MMKNSIIIICICFVLKSCSIFSNENEITQGIYFFPSGLDPAVNTNLFEYQIFSQIYEPLLTLDGDYQTIKPCLADSWSLSNDKKVYTFRLKPNVYFHDGSRLTAQVVQFSFLYQMQVRSESPLIKLIDTIVPIDSLTIEIKLKHSYLPFLYSLASPNGLMVMSMDALINHRSKVNRYPSGTGPFYLDQWVKDKNIILRAFPSYREKSRIDVVKFVLPDSTEQPEILLKNGELDILYMVASHWLDRLKWTGMIDYFVQKPLNTLFIGFNLKNEPVNNKVIRDAISFALDTEKNVYITNRGNAISAKGPLPPVYPGFEDLRQDKFNKELSYKLICEEGYEDGLTLNLFIFAPTFSRQTRIEIIKSQLEKVGIELNTEFYYEDEKFILALDSSECHLFLDGYSSEVIGDPGNFLYALFHSNSPYNHFNYENEDVNLLLEEAFREINHDERHKRYRSVVKRVLESTPAVFESHVKSHYAFNSKKIKSLEVSPYEFIYFHRLETYE
jgi:peptide/nickel transport system substrate-binding protein